MMSEFPVRWGDSVGGLVGQLVDLMIYGPRIAGSILGY